MKIKKISNKIDNWTPPVRPNLIELEGRYTRLAPLCAQAHSEPLFRANSADDSIWDYLPYGPYATVSDYRSWVADAQGGHDPAYVAIMDKEHSVWAGVASFMRINPEMGVIEVGGINYARRLQRTRAATETMYLMMKWAFEAGYRRYEWKCNALNMPSRRAAQRLGFSYEGIFRQSMIVKNRNRDTAWFAIIDSEWPALKQAFQQWLAPENFDGDGRQLCSLATLTAPVRVSQDPELAEQV
ncbi:MAG: GNAT family protein [Paracoccaceae bacterium]